MFYVKALAQFQAAVMAKAKLNTTRLRCLILQSAVSAKLLFNSHQFVIELKASRSLRVSEPLAALGSARSRSVS